MEMQNENLIATLEQSLRQTRNSRTRLMARLREIEAEAESLKEEIEALDNSAEQMEAAIHSLLSTTRMGRWSSNKELESREEEKHASSKNDKHKIVPPPRTLQQPASRNVSNNGYPRAQETDRNSGYRNNSVSYLSNSRNISPIIPEPEVRGSRFSDRTITQACTILLREYGREMHVNELYNLLLDDGFQFTGNNPTISIAVSLNRNRRFRRVAPGTFDLIMRDASQAVS